MTLQKTQISQKLLVMEESFQCRICLDSPSKPVATVCGHVFWCVPYTPPPHRMVGHGRPSPRSWPCLFQWLKHNAPTPSCPVCKAAVPCDGGDVSKAKVVPLYVGEQGADPRSSRPSPPPPHGRRGQMDVPERPQGERPPQATNSFAHNVGGGGVGADGNRSLGGGGMRLGTTRRI
jgi:hypothetical protein